VSKSASSENTFAEDLTDLDTIRQEVADMAADVCGWLERKDWLARTVTIKVRYSDFTTVTRSHSDAPTRNREAIVARAVQLLARTAAGQRPVRLLGVGVHNFCDTVSTDTSGPQRLPFEADDAPN
jgi:DNA polymerase-4